MRDGERPNYCVEAVEKQRCSKGVVGGKEKRLFATLSIHTVYKYIIEHTFGELIINHEKTFS